MQIVKKRKKIEMYFFLLQKLELKLELFFFFFFSLPPHFHFPLLGVSCRARGAFSYGCRCNFYSRPYFFYLDLHFGKRENNRTYFLFINFLCHFCAINLFAAFFCFFEMEKNWPFFFPPLPVLRLHGGCCINHDEDDDEGWELDILDIM